MDKLEMLRKVLFAILLAGAAAGPRCFALDPHQSVKRFQIEAWRESQGLSYSTINAVLQASDGYLWIATYYGLVRFDGVQFRYYNSANTPALPHDRIWALSESAGELWVGTSRGLARLRGGIFQTVGAAEGLPEDAVRALERDKKGTLWVGTMTNGLFRWDGQRFHPEGPKTYIRSLSAARSGRLLVGTKDGLFIRAKDGKWGNAGGSRLVAASIEDRNGTVWAGTQSGLARLENDVLVPVPGTPDVLVWSLYEDSHDILWAGTFGKGLLRLRGNQIEGLDVEDGLASEIVSSLVEDREGALWIGTGGGGLNRLRDASFNTLTRARGFRSNLILPVIEGDPGVMWVGTNGGGISRVENDRVVRTWTKADGMGEDWVWSLETDGHGGVWAGTFSGGLHHIDRRGRVRRFTNADGLSSEKIFALKRDRSGALWIGTYDGGLNVLRHGRMEHFGRAQGLPDEQVRVICQDKAGTLWVGTRAGLSRWNGTKFDTYTTRDGLSNNFVLSFHEDAAGTKWVGTFGGGLNRLRDGRFHAYRRQDGLHDDVVFQILEDDLKYLWLSGSTGIGRVSKAELEAHALGRLSHINIKQFGIEDGMAGQECQGGQPAGWRSTDGRLWFSTVSGVTVADPKKLAVNRQPPPVHIEAVVVAGKTVPATKNLELPAGTANLEFQYTALSLSAPRRVRFKYQLEGFDKGWIDGETRRSAYYTNLPPGPYRFRVIASNNDGVWNGAGDVLEFSIQPLFYETTWFTIACVAGVLMTGAFGYTLRLRSLLRRNVQLEEHIAERTRSLAKANEELSTLVRELKRKSHELKISKDRAEHASRAKSDFVANISHELRTPMNGIIGMTSLALATPLNAEQAEYVQLARQSAESLLALLNDVLDFSKIEAGHLRLDRRPFVLREAVSEVLSAFKVRALEKGIGLELRIATDVWERINGDPLRLRQVLVNLLGNALKFTSAGQVEVHVDVVAANEEMCELQFSIRDTGIGIPPDMQAIIFEPFQQGDSSITRAYGGTGLGLSICRDVVRLMGGRIWVESAPGEGSTFRFTCPFTMPGQAPTELPEPVLSEHGGSLRVLLAEDNAVNQRVAKRLLEKMGHEVIVAANGRLAVEACEAERFDVILMDVQMPEVDGITAAGQIKQRQAETGEHTPIIALTAHAFDYDRERCMLAGMEGYLSKPVSPESLKAALQMVMPGSGRGN